MNAATARAPRRALDLRSEKLTAVLDAAAAEFNAYGVAGASLSRIARAVGLTRAALYYYFESREDLAFHCYLRACREMAADLEAAGAARDGLSRVRGFILHTLEPSRPARAVLSEFACLGEARRTDVEAAHEANVARLRRFIEAGARDGSMRKCDAEVVAQTLMGILSWVPLAAEWAAGPDVRAGAARAVADLVSDGLATDPDYPLHCALDVADFAHKPGNAFDRDAASATKVELLARTASRLFNRRGIDGTSMDQVAQALGATKGAVYHHLPDKTALLVECHRRQLEMSARIAEAAGRTGRNGLERGMLGMHLLVQAFASDLSPLSPLTGLEALPARARASIQKQGAALAQTYERYNAGGIKDGSLRPFEARALATLGAGVFSWIPKWRSEDDPRTPRQIADETVALFVRGLRSRA